MHVGIVAQHENERAARLAADLRDHLRESDITVLLDETTADRIAADGVPPSAMAAADLVVSIGGDGTFLYAAREVEDVPIMGVNLGEVGFLNGVSPAAAIEAVDAEIETYRETGTIRARDVHRIAVRNEALALSPALNEIVVHGPHRGHGGGCTTAVRVDGSPFSESRGDGVLVATPTGSTAYNLSERGPLLHPAVDGLVITGMCHEDPMPSLVVDLESEIAITVSGAETAAVIVDGRDRVPLEPPETIRIGLAESPVRIAGPAVDFFEALGKLD